MPVSAAPGLVELQFKAPSESEPHVLIDCGGTIPADLLDRWTTEFRRVWERHGGSRTSFSHEFSNRVPNLPYRFEISFRGTGRDRSAVLVSYSPTGLAVSSSRTKGNSPILPPPDWRESLLAELNSTLNEAKCTSEGTYFLRNGMHRFQELLRNNSEQAPLMMFGAFITVSHEHAVQDDDHVLAALYDGASAALQRIVLSAQDADGPSQVPVPSVFARFSRMFSQWLRR